MTFLDLERKVSKKEKVFMGLIKKILATLLTTGKFSNEVRHTISGAGASLVVVDILTAAQAADLVTAVVTILTSETFYTGIGLFVSQLFTSRKSDKEKAVIVEEKVEAKVEAKLAGH